MNYYYNLFKVAAKLALKYMYSIIYFEQETATNESDSFVLASQKFKYAGIHGEIISDGMMTMKLSSLPL